jgi:hypothetical protein
MLKIWEERKECDIGSIPSRRKIKRVAESGLNTKRGASFGKTFGETLRPGRRSLCKKKNQYHNPQPAPAPHTPSGKLPVSVVFKKLSLV